MANNVADELMIIRAHLKQAGWVRLNGNTWALPTGQAQWELRTAYVHGEATLELKRADGVGKPRTYRGAEPLSWAKTEAQPVLKKIFGKPLDTLAEAE